MLLQRPFLYFFSLAIGYSLASCVCLTAKPKGFHLKSGEAQAPILEKGTWVIKSGKKAMIDWESFSIDQKETIQFQQKDKHSYVLNRVMGENKSLLLGELLSNGSVYLINPQGILIGPNARIETAGFIASTLDILNEDLSGRALHFSGDSQQGVVNQGVIHCPAGDIFLIGRTVENSGTLSAPNGRQGMLSSCDVWIQPEKAPEIIIRSDQKIDMQELKENPYALAIQHSGKSTANAVYLMAEKGVCEVSGDIHAQKGDEGGEVHVLGTHVHLIDNAHIEASGKNQGGKVLIGGDYRGKNPAIHNAKTVWAGPDTQVCADALESGNGGEVIFWSDEQTFHYGKITIRGGAEGGNGGFAEVSGNQLDYRGFTDGSAPCGKMGSLLLDPNDVVIGSAATTGTFSACPNSNYNFVNATATNQILNTDLQTQLGSCSVTIDTSSGSAAGGAGPNQGSITVNSAVSWSAATTLTLTAKSFMVLNAGLTNTSASSGFTAISLTSDGILAGANAGITLNTSGNLTANGGNILVSGTSAAVSTASHGVNFNGGTVITTSGAITVTGFVPVGATGNNIYGVNMNTTNGISSTSGSITLSGSTNTIGNGGYGFQSNPSGGWTAGTTGDVTFTNCVGGTGANTYGVALFKGVTTAGNIVATNNIAAGAGNGTNVSGGFFTGNGSLSSTGGGNITITASSAAVTSLGTSQGLTFNGVISTTGNGAITLIGTGSGATPNSYGLNGVFQMSSQNGPISITGFTTAGSGIGIGVNLPTTSNTIRSTTGSITLSGTSNTTGAGSIGVFVTNNGTTWATGTSGTLTFANCSGGTGTASDGVRITNGIVASGDVVFTNCTGGSNVTTGGNGVTISSLLTTTGAITATSGILGQGNGGVGFSNASSLTTSGTNKNINITATSNATTGAAHGISLVGGSISTTGGGSITLSGTGGDSVTTSHGISVSGTTTISTSTGNGPISLTGVASGPGAGVGINLNSGVTNVINSTSGSITLNGTSSASTAGAYGIFLLNSWTAGTSATVTLTGTGGPTGASHGITLQSLTNPGPIILNGTPGGGAGSFGNSLSGNITTTGTSQTISGSTILGTTITLNTTNATPSGANIVFSGPSATIDGTTGLEGLVLTAGTSGAITLGGAIGSITPLASLSVTGAAINISQNITTNGGIIAMTGPVTLTGSPTFDSTNSGGKSGANISFSSLLNGNDALTLRAGTAGIISFSGIVGGVTPLTNLSFISGNTIRIANNITVSGAFPLNFSSPVSLTGPSTITSNGAQIFFNTIDGAQALTLIAGTGVVALNGAIGGATPLTNLSFTSASQIQIGANITLSGANPMSFPDPVLLTGSSTLVSTGRNITFNSTLDGAQALTLTAGLGTVIFNHTVGGIAPLTSLSFTSANQIQIGANITLTGASPLSFPAPVSLIGPSTITSNSGDITFNNILNGAQPLTLVGGTGTTTFNGTIGGITPLTSLSATAGTINQTTTAQTTGALSYTASAIDVSGNITTNSSAISMTGPVVIANTPVFNTTNSGAGANISFSNTVNGNTSLAVQAGSGTVSFSGAVGDITPLTNLSFVSAATIQIGSDVTVSGANPLDFSSPVTLTGTSIITNPNKAITFNSTLNGGQNLALAAGTGTIQFNAAVGNSAPLTNLAFMSAGLIEIGNNITVNGAHPLSFPSPVSLIGPSTITSNSGDITFNNTLDGTQTLTLVGGTGTTTFNGAIGGTTPLISLSATASTIDQTTTAQTMGALSYTASAIDVSGNITTNSGAISMTGPVLLANAPVFNTTNSGIGANISFSNIVNGNTSLAVQAGSGTVSFSGAVGDITPLTNLSFLSAATIQIGSDVTVSGANPLDFSSSVTLTGTSIITNPNKAITFNSTLNGAHSLSLAAGTGAIQFDAAVGNSAPLTNLVFISAGLIEIGNNITVSGANPLSFPDPVSLIGPSTITSNGSDITFNNTLDGAEVLTLVGGTDTTTFEAAVGGTTPLTSLSATASTINQTTTAQTTGALSYTASAIDVSGNITTSSGVITMTGPVLIANAPVFNTTNSGAGANISFSNTVNGNTSLAVQAGSGTVNFSGAVGDITPLTNLSFVSAATIQIGSDVTVSGANPLDFSSPVTLTGTSIITNPNKAITFNSTLNGGQNLTLAAGIGTIQFDAAVGNSAPLTNLAFMSAGLIEIGNNITVSGANPLNFPSPVSVTGPSTITSNSSDITFNNTLDGAQTLTLVGGTGTTTFNGAIGGITPLTSLLATAGTIDQTTTAQTTGALSYTAFAIDVSGNITTSSGAISMTGPVLIANAPVFDTTNSGMSSGANITFSTTINGATSLTFDAGNGDILLGGAIGEQAAPGALLFSNAANITVDDAVRAASLTQLAGSGTTDFEGDLHIVTDISLTGTNFLFDGILVTGNNLTINNSGLFSITTPGAIILNGAFLQSGAGPAHIQGNITTSSQDITFNSAVTLLGNTTLNAGDALIFDQTVDGSFNLVLNGNSISFGGVVGSTPLNSLEATAATTITTAGNQTVANGPMQYTGNVILTTDTQFFNNGTNPLQFLASSGNSITGNFSLVLMAPHSSVYVQSDVVLTGSNGSMGGSCAVFGNTNVGFDGQILAQGGTAVGQGGAGGVVSLISNAGSVSVHNINVSGGTGGTQGNAGNILLQPSNATSGGLPNGKIILNEDLSSTADGNLVALGGGGANFGNIMLSAHRSSSVTVATITSSLNDNDISISGTTFTMGQFEAMTCLGNLTISCLFATLGDLVALDNLTIDTVHVNLLTHGDELILNNLGVLYVSPTLHFLGGTGYSQTGVLTPPGPLNAKNLNFSPATFRPLLILNPILNYDTSPQPPPPTPSVITVPSTPSDKRAIYQLLVADTAFFDILPIYPDLLLDEVKRHRTSLPGIYWISRSGHSDPVHPFDIFDESRY